MGEQLFVRETGKRSIGGVEPLRWGTRCSENGRSRIRAPRLYAWPKRRSCCFLAGRIRIERVPLPVMHRSKYAHRPLLRIPRRSRDAPRAGLVGRIFQSPVELGTRQELALAPLRALLFTSDKPVVGVQTG